MGVLLTTLLLSQLSSTMAGPSVRPLTPAGTHSDLFSANPTVECDGSALTTTLGESVVSTRASTAFCTKSNGTLVSVASGSPRVSNSGILIEGARTNSLIRSQEMSTSWNNAQRLAVVVNDAVAPDGTTTAEKLTLTTDGVTPANNYMILATNITETHPSTWARSVYGKLGTVNFMGITRNNGTTEYEIVNLSTGLHDSTNGGVRGYAESVTGAWYRAVWAFSTASTNGVSGIYIRAGDTALRARPQPTSYIAAGTEQIWGWGAQAELGAFASSYVPTTTTAVTRAADDVHFTPAAAMSAAGCVSGSVTFGQVPTTSMRIIGGAVATGVYLSSSTAIQVGDGTNTVTASGLTLTNATKTFKATWTGTTLTLQIDEGAVTSGTFDGDMDMGTAYLGSQAGTSNHLFGYLKTLRFAATSTGCD